MANTPTANRFARQIVRWFQTHKRDLPWRRNRDPYRIWVSEIMLQQTQVKTVVPYFERFVARFPDLNTLARAKESEVLAQWSGLGYYSRARNLHRAAQRIAGNGFEFPQNFNEILELPGIGRYTAGAIASIAFDAVCPVVDGNVRRLLSRYFGKALTETECWQSAAKLLPVARSGEFNQALMEIGATICRPDRPLCCECPVRLTCASRGGPFPDLRKQIRSVARSMAVLVLSRRRKFWIEQRGPFEELLKNLWCFPLHIHDKFPGKSRGVLSRYAGVETRHAASELRRDMSRRYGPGVFKSHGSFRHSIMQYRLNVHVFSAQASQSPSSDGIWVSDKELRQYPHSSIVEKTLKRLASDELKNSKIQN